RHTSEVLAEVQNIDAGFGLANSPGLELLDGAHRRAGMRPQARLNFGAASHHRVPIRGVEARLVPAGAFQSGIIRFALKKIGLENRAGGRLPIRSCADVGAGAVGVFEVELGAQPGMLAIEVAVTVITAIAAAPTN